jgi:outer membrane protein OmpA-like peptidoglycan-associated protein
MKKIVLLISLALVLNGYSQPKKMDLFDPSTVKIMDLPVNTSLSDFGPAVIDDSLFFTSFNEGLQNKSQKEIKKKAFYDLFSSKIDNQGNTTGDRRAIFEFITRYHDGPVSYCPKTGELFITQSNYLEPGAAFKPFRKNYFNLRIIIAKRINGVWKMTESFLFNNPKYSVGHPAISFSGDTLIFSSDKPGGLGETDLYMSIRNKGLWSDPVNLGNRINTSGKDEFPSLTKNGYLIFSSDGRQGMGGLDLYYTKLNDPKAEVVHFDSPINSINDDFAMIILPDSGFGYLTSDRSGGKGSDDIYKISFKKYREFQLELLVMDSKSRRPIPGADLGFDDLLKLKSGNGGLIARKIQPDMAYSVTVKAFGYNDKTKSIKTDLFKFGDGDLMRDTVWMDMIVKRSIVMRNIYYDFDRWDILPESREELDKLTAFMVENPDIKVELSSHTDSRGSKAYNQKLSERRAQSAVDYIISKGISADRITAKGYGESMPVNKCVDGVPCTPEEYRMNRRTEFYIPEFGKSHNVDQTGKGDITVGQAGKSTEARSVSYYVVVGSFTDLPNADKMIDQLKADGYQAEIIKDGKFFKVGVIYKDKKSAQEGLNKLNVKYPGAWIK